MPAGNPAEKNVVLGSLVSTEAADRVQSLIKGVPHEVYYWCDVCAIRRGEKMICECCNGPMELVEQPVKK